MVAKFEKGGIHFQYPENWDISEEEGSSPSRCITLQSPESGFWMVQLFDSENDPDEVAADVLRSVRQEYEDLEVVEVQESIATTETIGYDLSFYCLDFVVSARIRCFTLGDWTCAVLCQAEDQEFDQKWPVFLALTISLLQAN